MSKFRSGQRARAIAVLLIFTQFTVACLQFERVDGPTSFGDSDGARNSVDVQGSMTVRELACNIDSLEKHIDTYGSAVAKQPDVWGQARLSKYRDEYEKQMAAELGNFVFTLNGSVSGADQAYFADAAALSAAASSPQATIIRRGGTSATTSTTTNNLALTPGSLTTPSSFTASRTTPAAGSPATPIPVLPLPDQSDTFSAFSNISRPSVNMPASLGFSGASGGIALEPVLFLDQKSQYLNHLHELRRINEGDDTADSPGYSLNLIRVPISVLPGKKTDVGYGAEVTMTLRPYLSDELLPTTFRNLVLNDLIEQIAFPITSFINDPQNGVYLDIDEHASLNVRDVLWLLDEMSYYQIPNSYYQNKNLPANPKEQDDRLNEFFTRMRELRLTPSLQTLFARPEWSEIDVALQEWAEIRGNVESQQNELEAKKSDEGNSEEVRRKSVHMGNSEEVSQKRVHMISGWLNNFSSIANWAVGRCIVPQTKSRGTILPFRPDMMDNIYGKDQFLILSREVYIGLSKEPFSGPATDHVQTYVHLPDVQGYLQQKLAAAYNLLEEPGNLDIWARFCTPELAAAIHDGRNRDIWEARTAFMKVLQRRGLAGVRVDEDVPANYDVYHDFNAPIPNAMTALTWAIIVESALLNQRLRKDIVESARLKGTAIAEPLPYDFFVPDPSCEARQAFNLYVQGRWPIHVFALDPTGKEQNLASTFSMRREMQLALSLAFVNGQISAQNMMRYARRVDFDFATVELNGTAVGFSHGEDTFGWRFFPRFQTPDVENNARVLFRQLLCGGPNKNQLLRQRRLEPGLRECYAVIIMPSFVPYADLNVSTNWFDLTNPQKKKLNSECAMELSHRVQSIQTASQCISDCDQYRNGDLSRLLERATQLQTRLPLQSTKVQIPFENTLGGFALFNTGVTDLAPELIGWYGTSSINPNAATTVFLAGNHFSVNLTSVIAGGQLVTNTQLLSRQVLQVTIPQNPILVGDASAKFVDVQVATPYGVTQHLLIPAVIPPKAEETPQSNTPPVGPPTQSIAWNPPTLKLAYTYGASGIVPPPLGTSTVAAPLYTPSNIIIQQGDIDPTKYNAVDITLQFDKKFALDKSNPITVTALYVPIKQGYEVPLGSLSSKIFTAFSAVFGPEDVNPPTALSTTTILSFKSTTDSSVPPLNKSTTNGLAIQWIKAPQAPGTKPAQ